MYHVNHNNITDKEITTSLAMHTNKIHLIALQIFTMLFFIYSFFLMSLMFTLFKWVTHFDIGPLTGPEGL